MQVLDCSNHLMSKMAPWREDRFDLATDAALNFMQKIKYGVKEGRGRHGKDCELKEFKPKSLSTMLRYEIVGVLYNEDQKFHDSIISLDEYLEDKE